MRHISQ